MHFRTKMMTINIGKIIEQGKKEGVFIDKPSNNYKCFYFFSTGSY